HPCRCGPITDFCTTLKDRGNNIRVIPLSVGSRAWQNSGAWKWGSPMPWKGKKAPIHIEYKTMRTIKNLSILFFIALLGCSSSGDGPNGPIVGGPSDDLDPLPTDDEQPSGDPLLYNATQDLKEVADFPMGNIVSAARLASTSAEAESFKTLLDLEYNSITAENDMKMANMFPGPDTYDFSDGDAIVAYAKAQGHRVHGHALLWHSSIPTWLANFAGSDAEFEAQVEGYIKATVAHFAQERDGEGIPIVASWDVVNEYFDGNTMRSSPFSQRMGADFHKKAFAWAREADPDVKLFYNDYNIAGEPGKRNAILTM